MVVLQRRRASATTVVDSVMINQKPDAQVPLGYEQDDSRRYHCSFSQPSYNSTPLIWVHDSVPSCKSFSRGSRGDNTSCHSPRSQSEPIKYLCSIAFLSWIAALYLITQSRSTLAEMQHQAHLQRHKFDQNKQSLKFLKEDLTDEANYIKNLEHTRDALQHEIRLLDELADADYDVTPTADSEELIELWLEHRKEGLEQRVEQLQRYLKEFSRTEAIKRFGPGPHHVRFTVEFADSGKKTKRSFFVVELAPLDLMPHSVYFFLEMIRMKIWDHTVFLHNEKKQQVIAAVPIDFRTQQVKSHHLAFLGWKGLAFPEYSPEWGQHAKYTLGFAKGGPTFYLNTADNVESHGPGGQDHHVLDGDADPCFAKVVEGREVIDDLIRFGLSHIKTSAHEDHPWADGEHALTHVISIEILANYNSP